jgi:hypothetical protein
MWTFILCEEVDTLTYNKISTCSLMAEMFLSVYTNNSEANNWTSLIQLLSRRESFGWSLWEMARTSVPRGVLHKIGAQQCWQHFRKKKKESIFLTHTHTNPTRQVDQQTKLSQLTKSFEQQKEYRSKWRRNTFLQSAQTSWVSEARW